MLQALPGQMGAYDIGALSPSDERFYARLGWKSWRGPLFVRTGRFLDVHAPLSVEWRPGEVW